jgi:uncharacterized protein (TIGR02271 family)
MFETSSYSDDIDWNDVIKKEARGKNDDDLGEVQQVTQDYVLVEKGIINKEKLYIPRELVLGFNGTILLFNTTAQEAKNKFLRDSPPVLSQSQFTGQDIRITDDLVIIPVLGEKLEVSKETRSEEAKVIKESITEVKTNQLPLIHDELYIETRPLTSNLERSSTAIDQAEDSLNDSSIPTNEEIITLFLKDEVPEVSKYHYLKEEIIVNTKPVTETRKFSEELRSEKVTAEGVIEK